MPSTPLGITYPDRYADTELWDHFQVLADNVNALITGDRARLTAIETTPHTQAVTNTAQQVAATTAVTVRLDASPLNVGLMADLPNNRLKVVKAGIYWVEGFVAFASVATAGTGYRRAQILRNGAAIRRGIVDASSTAGLATSVPVPGIAVNLAVDDVLTLEAFHTYTAALNLDSANGHISSLSARRIA